LSDATADFERHAVSLRNALRELLQYDRSDLDFGIYRILNQRRDEIERFLEEELIASVTEGISGAGVEEAEQESLAAQVCADLARFFERYYDSGDFLPLRRYRAGAYSVPYEGEEVLLHWANRDQYYIKDAEQLSAYSFVLPEERIVRFVVVSTDEDAEGNKPSSDEERRYALADPPFILNGPGELVVRWAFLAKKKGIKQADLNADAVEALLSDNGLEDWRVALGSSKSGPSGDASVLTKHITDFTTRNTYDYFVHRDLGGFLRGELEAFLKAEIIRLDELEQSDHQAVARNLARMVASRAAALPVIEFLGQIEDFQKRLWLKRKLVLESSWLVTLDLVPTELLPAVVACTPQREAWLRDLAVDDLDGWADPPSPDFLRKHGGLVLDTTHFDREFVQRLLASIDDIDAATIGWAIDGDCFQALRLAQSRFQGQVTASYIDPPYNTGGGDFLYKDRYQHSSWLSMIRDRLALGRKLLAENGVQVSSIDDDEHPRLRLALDEVFGADNFIANVIWQKKYAPANDATWFSDDHDHLLFYAKAKHVWRPERLPRTSESDKAYKNPDDDPRGPWKAGDYIQAKTREERPNGWYGIVRPVDGMEIWPNPQAVWRYKHEQHEQNLAEDRVWWGKDGLNDVPAFKRFLSEVGNIVPRTVWLHQDVGHNQDAVRDLQALFGVNPFRNPKPLKLLRRILTVCPGDLVLDYFAGSGTLGHAVIDERREGTAERRFILAEQGPHFETVLRPRLTKALHAGAWRRGKPESRKPVSGMVQLLRLETYDDALDAIELVRTEQQASLLESAPGVARDHFLRYLLPTEGRAHVANTGVFAEPFSARTVATVEGVREEVSLDIPETFNWLLGLRVRRIANDDGLLAFRGLDRRGRETLVTWRDRGSVTDDAFETWFLSLPAHIRDGEVSTVYVNGDTDIGRRRPDGEHWEVHLIEDAFLEMMFDEVGAP
jgi:adenine-specific DNA-methyltransferase